MKLEFKIKRWPRLDEIVVGKVTKITPYSAWVELLEFEDKTGMIPVYEASKSVVRNIKEVLREGQVVFAKVIRVIPEREVLDLSIKRLTESEKRAKREHLKKEIKAEHIIKMVAQEIGKDPQAFFDKHFRKVKEEEMYVYPYFVRAVDEGGRALRKFKLPKTAQQRIIELCKKYFAKEYVVFNNKIQAYSLLNDGVVRLRTFFQELYNVFSEIGKDVELKYLGAPNYYLSFKAQNPKKVEKNISEIVEKLKKRASELGVSFSFVRER